MKSTKFLYTAVILSFLVCGNAIAQKDSSKVIWMCTTKIAYAKIPEFESFFQHEMLPVYNEAGYHIIANWENMVGDLEELIYVAEFHSLADYERSRVYMASNPKWKAIRLKLDGFVKEGNTKLLQTFSSSSPR